MKYIILDTVFMEIPEGILYKIQNQDTQEIGGWIQSESNLSQTGNCWINDEAKVYGNAVVSENAMIADRAAVFGDAVVKGSSVVCNDSRVCGTALVQGTAVICDTASVEDNSIVDGTAVVSKKSRLTQDTHISSPNDIDYTELFGFQITITKDYTTIGCMTKTRDDWNSMTNEELLEFGVGADQRVAFETLVNEIYDRIPENNG